MMQGDSDEDSEMSESDSASASCSDSSACSVDALPGSQQPAAALQHRRPAAPGSLAAMLQATGSRWTLMSSATAAPVHGTLASMFGTTNAGARCTNVEVVPVVPGANSACPAMGARAQRRGMRPSAAPTFSDGELDGAGDSTANIVVLDVDDADPNMRNGSRLALALSQPLSRLHRC